MSRVNKSYTDVWLILDSADGLPDDEPHLNLQPTAPEKIKVYSYQHKGIPASKNIVGVAYENHYNQEGIGLDYHLNATRLYDYQTTNALLGKLLTFMDATFTDTVQREAQKKILKQVFWNFNDFVSQNLERKFKDAKVEEN